MLNRWKIVIFSLACTLKRILVCVCICNHIKYFIYTQIFLLLMLVSKNWKWIVFYMFYVCTSDIWVFVMYVWIWENLLKKWHAQFYFYYILLFFSFFSCEYECVCPCQINLNLLTFYAAYFTSFISKYAQTHTHPHTEK